MGRVVGKLQAGKLEIALVDDDTALVGRRTDVSHPDLVGTSRTALALGRALLPDPEIEIGLERRGDAAFIVSGVGIALARGDFRAILEGIEDWRKV